MNEIIAINLLAERFCDKCKFSDNRSADNFCKNSKRKQFELPNENTCEFWELNERL